MASRCCCARRIPSGIAVPACLFRPARPGVSKSDAPSRCRLRHPLAVSSSCVGQPVETVGEVTKRAHAPASPCSGRGPGCPGPPAQIPACGFPAPGSCRRSNAIEVRGFGGPCTPDPQACDFGYTPHPALIRGVRCCSPSLRPAAFPPPSPPPICGRLCSRLPWYYAAVRLLTSPATASPPRLPVVARPRRSGLGEARSPKFRRFPSIRNGVSDLGRAVAPCITVHNVLPSTVTTVSASARLSISRLNIPLRMIAVYASQPSSPATTQHSLGGGSLLPTLTGLPPAGKRQLRLAHCDHFLHVSSGYPCSATLRRPSPGRCAGIGWPRHAAVRASSRLSEITGMPKAGSAGSSRSKSAGARFCARRRALAARWRPGRRNRSAEAPAKKNMLHGGGLSGRTGKRRHNLIQAGLQWHSPLNAKHAIRQVGTPRECLISPARDGCV